MSPERWGSVRAALERAWEAPVDRRGVLLQELCGDDGALRSEVESLLDAGEQATPEFLEHSPLVMLGDVGDEAVQDGVQLGTRIGRYSIERLIARGGMGAVYLARQDQPSRLVAIKLLRSDLATEAGRRAFVREVEVLGRLRHPGIAQVYEADEWRPSPQSPSQAYIAMEYVEDGVPITEYASTRGLSIRDRVKLFLSSCEAIEHAHQRAVIHRDIKPSNVLVSQANGAGSPKVIDFGIARMLEGDPFESRDLTESGRVVGTVLYMSPEQIGGRTEDIDTRTDVYSLGVLLYELLTGALPHDTRQHSLFAAMKAARESDAVPPRRRNAELPRDLDAIVLQALRRDPQRRYQSVGALETDLRRWLSGSPVEARPAGALYRFACLVRQHKAATAGVVGVFAALAIGLATTSWQAVRASRSEARVTASLKSLRELTNSLVFELPNVLDTRGATEARLVLVQTGIQYLDQLASEASSDATLAREVANGFSRMAQVQGYQGIRNVGDTEGAVASMRRAIEVRRNLAGSLEGTYADRNELAQDHRHLAVLLADLGRTSDAVAEADAAIRLRMALCEERGDSYAPRSELAECVRMCASVFESLGVLEAVKPSVQTGIEFLTALPRDIPTSPTEQALRGAMCSGLAQTLGLLGQSQRAIMLFDEAAAVQGGLATAFPRNVTAHLNDGDVYRYRGQLNGQLGIHGDAVLDFTRAVACYRRAVELDPGHYDAADVLSITLAMLSRSQLDVGMYRDAIASAEDSVEIVSRQVAADGKDQRSLNAIIDRVHMLGLALLAGANDRSASIDERKAMAAQSREQFARALGLARSRPAGSGAADAIPTIEADLSRSEVVMRDLR